MRSSAQLTTRKILIVADAPGPAEFILPVIPLLKEKNEVSVVTIMDSPTKILEKYTPIRCDKESDAEPIYKKINPDLLLVAMSSRLLGPYVNNAFTALARQDDKKIICFQDYWANHRNPMNFKMIKLWDAVLVMDELAQQLILQDGYEGGVVVTGNPAFDKFKTLNVGQERARWRKKLQVPNDAFVILHCGTGTPQSFKEDEVTFKFVADAIRSLNKNHPNIVFISRPHPRDENPKRYLEMAPDLTMLDTSVIPITDEILPTADVVLAMYSTNLIHACYLRIPGISILLPNGGKKLLERVSLADFPPNAVGATIGIYKESVKDFVDIIEYIMNNPEYRSLIKKSQEQFYPLPKTSAAHNAADFINSFFPISS